MTSLANAQPLVDLVSAAATVALLCQFTKFLVDYLIKPTSPNHTNFVRLYVYLLAAAVVVLYSSATTAIVFTGQFITGVLAAVLAVGTSAISVYHALTGLPGPTPASTTGDSSTTVSDLPTQMPPTKTLAPATISSKPPIAAVPVTPAAVEAASTPASDPAQRI